MTEWRTPNLIDFRELHVRGQDIYHGDAQVSRHDVRVPQGAIVQERRASVFPAGTVLVVCDEYPSHAPQEMVRVGPLDQSALPVLMSVEEFIRRHLAVPAAEVARVRAGVADSVQRSPRLAQEIRDGRERPEPYQRPAWGEALKP